MLDRFEQFTSMISALHRDVQKIERDEMEKRGLRGAFAQYLLAISRHPGGITAAALCETCDKDKAAVSRIISEMESKGLLEKENDGISQYRARLRLTPEGQATADFVRERASIAVELAGSGLSDEDRKAFYSALMLISSNLQKICADGIPEKDGL
jgi:DNA-binding MarR family transcriptional regulator